MRLGSEMKIALCIEFGTDEVTVQIEDNFEDSNSNRRSMNQRSQKSSNTTSPYGNFLWFEKSLREETLKGSYDNPKTNASKKKTCFMADS